MNKKVITSFMAAVSALTITSTAALANIGVMVNGNNLAFDVPPTIINDCTMVPMRAIFESLGAEVEWDPEDRAVYAFKDNTIIVLAINIPYMAINDDTIELESAPVIMSDTTLVPVRAVSEAFNMDVSWDAASQTVLIYDKGSSVQQAPSQTPTQSQPTQSQPTQAPQPATQQPASSNQDLGHQVLALVNQYRQAAGLGTLVWDDALAAVATSHSNDMAAKNFFDHYNMEGLSPFDRMHNFGITYMNAAENIAAGQQTAEAVMDSWMNSPGHYKNIMTPEFNKMGIGVAYGGSYGIYWTQCFTN